MWVLLGHLVLLQTDGHTRWTEWTYAESVFASELATSIHVDKIHECRCMKNLS